MLADEYKKSYHLASRKDKAAIVTELVNRWRCSDPPGRFLIRTDPSKGACSLWHDVGEDMSMKKAAKILSERSVEFRAGSKRKRGPSTRPAQQTRNHPQIHRQAQGQVLQQPQALTQPRILEHAQSFPRPLPMPRLPNQPHVGLAQPGQPQLLHQLVGGHATFAHPPAQEYQIPMFGQQLNSQMSEAPGAGFRAYGHLFVQAAFDMALRHPSDAQRRMQSGQGRGLSLVGSTQHTAMNPAGSNRGERESHPGAAEYSPDAVDTVDSVVDAGEREGVNVPTAASLSGVFSSSESSDAAPNYIDSSDEG
jgi:hypothetical protein